MTENHPLATVCDRILIKIDGEDSQHFLHNLITTDVEKLENDTMLPGALLTPQGKIAFDFLIGKKGESFFIDINKEIAPQFIKRLSMYKLRSKVNLTQENQYIVEIFNQENNDTLVKELKKQNNLLFFNDKRFLLNQNIIRNYKLNNNQQCLDKNIENYISLRIANAVAESSKDYQLNDAFPHDVNLDQLSGVSFKKGCYIGQEVVSRMHHRKTARRRILIAKSSFPLPQSGTSIEADSKPVGTIGSVNGVDGLAMVRIDRVKQAIDQAIPLIANGIEITLEIPSMVNFTFPENLDKGD
ncbi:folate-binding protein YgfZ [Bartonella sp. HY329]|uniref:CAF17-like 4Fe-4S cluster assembly/insertion protein YgfZ n=1 Tax=unclassified Bartonella TaxID=2645622 RepID=UPI0021C6EA92|nr:MULTISPECIES: folate-binding protein YgfZ [unclassified Bartonella]UXM94385.1 folate-binding protein YgfZ [Bartonella sp. HY329]UXN08708.1 folate-binding protein YgfZ [Bartonella sp. HY328]